MSVEPWTTDWRTTFIYSTRWLHRGTFAELADAYRYGRPHSPPWWMRFMRARVPPWRRRRSFLVASGCHGVGLLRRTDSLNEFGCAMSVEDVEGFPPAGEVEAVDEAGGAVAEESCRVDLVGRD